MHEGHRERMRERYISQGASGFAPHEIFEMLLYYTNTRKNTNPIAHDLLSKHTPSEVFDADINELMKTDGVGRNTAEFIKFVHECMQAYKDEKSVQGNRLMNVTEVGDYLCSHIEFDNTEKFYMLCLDINNRVLSLQKVAEGEISNNIVDNREVIGYALRNNAYSVVLAHTHPGGSLKASGDDVELNNRLREVLEGINIRLKDHFIIVGKSFISMAEHGYFNSI